jgi:hypothetical protein
MLRVRGKDGIEEIVGQRKKREGKKEGTEVEKGD